MKGMFCVICMTAALGIGAGGSPAVANAAMNTGDIQINAYTYGDQVNPAIAMAPDGRFVIAWTNKDPDGDGDDIFAQRYDISGNAVGPEFQVNTSTAGNQYDPAVAMAPNGNFVITWTNNKQHGDWRGIYGQRYDSVGNPIGSEFKVNIHTISLKDRSSAAVDSHGNFVITWSSHNQDGDGWEVYARRYDSAGNPAGPEFRVNTQTTGHQEGSSIGMDTDGNFVIAWVSRSKDDDGWGIYGRRFDPSGLGDDSEFEVQRYPGRNTHHHRTSVAMSSRGDFVIVWAKNDQEDEWQTVYGQLYSRYGIAEGPPFEANTFMVGNQDDPCAVMDAYGNFVITWTNISKDISSRGVYGQRFDSSGDALGPEFKINTFSSGYQSNPSAAMDANGNFVIAWSSRDQDGDGYGLFMKEFPY